MLKTQFLKSLVPPSIKKIRHCKYGRITFLDESKNPSGTHKDRMAHSIANTYQKMFKNNEKLRLSLISSGSAAHAIQLAISEYGLPPLKVLIDESRREDEILKKIGCEVYTFDLESRMLSSSDILKLTNNEGGIEITSNMAINPYNTYYKGLTSYLSDFNSGYIFTPFGSGHLYGSFLTCDTFDEPFNVHIVGGKTHFKDTKADKLYAPFNPFSVVDENFINTKIAMRKVGRYSSIIEFKEESLQEAINIATHNNFKVEPSALGGLAAMIDMFNNSAIKYAENKLVVVTGMSRVYAELNQVVA